jgi:uncharacterized protein (UPF0261 family)
MEVMIRGATRCALSLYHKGHIKGILGLGGSMGTTLGTGVMRSFPVGFPKVMISTMGAQNMRTFVGTKDILVLNSVSDLAGLNRVTKKILRNGAMAISGMVKIQVQDEEANTPLVLMSSMGTTETCAKWVRCRLAKKGIESITFHSTGDGGRAMEGMIREENVNAVVDLSLHELIDHHFGGIYDSGADRCTASISNQIPTVLIPGNIDFLVAGRMMHAKQKFGARKYHKHNAHITCVGTTLSEIRYIAKLLADRCNKGTGPIAMLVPANGFSDFSKPGGPLANLDGPPLFAQTFLNALKRSVEFEYLPCHINDHAFIDSIFIALEKIEAFRWRKESKVEKQYYVSCSKLNCLVPWSDNDDEQGNNMKLTEQKAI